MILQAGGISNGATLAADVCIIGGGPAAIVLALEIASAECRVLMLPGGGWFETPENQSLHQGIVYPPRSHEPLEENRRRQFGGASAAWGGRCIPFDPVDFEKRHWIDKSGWPLSYQDLEPFYQRATEWCHAGEFRFDAREAFPDSPDEIISGFDDQDLHSRNLERWSPPIRFAKKFRKEIEANPNLEVLLDAHAVELCMDDGPDRISSVRIATGRCLASVKATRFVLAAGGIENPRLLLASSNAHCPGGIGNQNDMVGRCYMSHLFGTFAEVRFKKGERVHTDFEMDEGVYCRRRWWFSSDLQFREKLRNTIFFLYRTEDREGHRDALFSAIFLAKVLLGIAAKRSPKRVVAAFQEIAPALKEHFRNLLRNGTRELPAMVTVLRKRLSKRRLPYVLPGGNEPWWGLFFQAEQSPLLESRVKLSDRVRDRLGMPVAEVAIRFDSEDVNSVVRCHRIFVDRFRALDVGEIRYDEAGLKDYLCQKISHFNSCAHHLGTTRMASNPVEGVVDGDSKVHGIENLFVAGASVFPTGGHANPTLTLLALTLRLGDHLRAKPV
jgi:choline dehydrogenase-like flavoprotein